VVDRRSLQIGLWNAAIDAYSRYITWIYIGVSAHTALCVLAQFLTTLKLEDIHPQRVRSDRGVEMTMLAAAHHAFMKKHVSDIPFNDCYWFGTSTANQRIEAWRGQLTKGMLYRWRVCIIFANLRLVMTH
jgi:hypothetical protein